MRAERQYMNAPYAKLTIRSDSASHLCVKLCIQAPGTCAKGGHHQKASHNGHVLEEQGGL